MATKDSIPTRDEVRRTLVAAADVIFSDGVPETFIDQWADETVFMLSLGESLTASAEFTGRQRH
jgi:hypothetical protein